MLQLTPAQTATLQSWFLPERPGPLVGAHIMTTGLGTCWVVRWPAPCVVMVECGGFHSLLGDAQALNAGDLQPHVRGFMECPESFAPLLYAAFPDLQVWQLVIFAPPAAEIPLPAPPAGVRRLEAGDTQALANLEPESAWICESWGGAEGLAKSGYGWGAFVDGQLAAVACSAFVGETYEDIGVVTITKYQRQGLSTACAGALCRDVRARGHQPVWETSPDNIASLRVAEKLGFQVDRQDVLYAIGVDIPT